MPKIPEEWRQYFWEVELDEVSLEEHADYVIGRILEHGTFEAVRQIRRYYGDKRLVEFLKSSHSRVLSNQTLRFWEVVLDLSPEECEKISSLRSKNPLWPY